MSLRSRPSSSGRIQDISTSDSFNTSHFKTYSFVHGDNEESLFDEDEDLKTRYLEKERALKKINEELERKSSEIFQKIEKYRYHESPSLRSFHHEIGQGDGPSLPEVERDHRLFDEDETSPTGTHQRKKTFRPYSSRSHFDYSRPFPDFDEEVSNFPRTNARDQSSEESLISFARRRPLTANPALISHNMDSSSSTMSHTESSIRKVEAAKSLEGIEEKHQARLQKATESVLKCVQSKLVNYEQRLADMHLQYRQKIQENTMLEAKVKAMEEDRRRLLKTVQTLQSTTDKFSKSAENSKMNLNLKSQAFASLKKEMDGLKKEIKQKNCMIQSLQTRLDRTAEENRRLKSQHQSTQINMKQLHNEDKTSMEELKQRIVQLEHQKSSFQATVEKQAQLIKNLRSHKVSQCKVTKKNEVQIIPCENEIEEIVCL